MALENKSTFKEFFHVIRNDLAALMSGGFSVVPGALAIYVDNKWQSLLWALTAMAAMAYAAYRIWLQERNRVLELENRLDPRILWGLAEEVAYESFTDKKFPDAKTYMVYVENKGDKTIRNCQIQIAGCFVCTPFELRPGCGQLVPIIRICLNDENKSYPAIHQYNEKEGTWECDQRWRPRGGNYRLKFVADDLNWSEIGISLSYSNAWDVREVAVSSLPRNAWAEV